MFLHMAECPSLPAFISWHHMSVVDKPIGQTFHVLLQLTV